VSHQAGGPGYASAPQGGGPGGGGPGGGAPGWPPPPPPASGGGWQAPPPPKGGIGKGVIAAVVAGVVAVTVAVTVVVVAPWSDTTGAGTDMSTDDSGNEVATLTMAFHPGWENESEAKWSHPDEPERMEGLQDPPDSVTWVGLNLDTAEALDMSVKYVGTPELVGPWAPLPESAETYAASHIFYKAGRITDNYDTEGNATYIYMGQQPPADLNDLENQLATNGEDLYVGGESPMSMWPSEAGYYLGFKTVAGSVGYLVITSIRDSAEAPGTSDGSALDYTIEITYLARP